MRFRPCIDIHNGKVKQIVGGTLTDEGDRAGENFVSEQDAAFYARAYRAEGLTGGHVIMLNPASSQYYEATRQQALCALAAWPGGLQVGGGINTENAAYWIDAGASHVIVTSYVFRDGRLDGKNLQRMLSAVGKSRLVLDLSCRKRDGKYMIVTDRWQKFTDMELSGGLLGELSGSCSEFLIHAVDVEGKASGADEELIGILAGCDIPVTYAGGVGSLEDLSRVKKAGLDRVDVTVGSALDIFGGDLPYRQVLEFVRQ